MLAGIALVLGVATLDHFRRSSLQPDVASASRLLEQAKREVTKVAPPESPLRKEEEKLEEARKQLGNSTDPMRDALRAIADLEKRLASASASPLTDEEKEALAKALAENEPQAAQALSSGNDREAAEQIAQMDPEALAKALEQAAQHRENSRLQELARKAGEQARRELAQGLASAGNSGAQRRLQQALREMKAGGQGQQQQGQGQGTEMALGKGGEKQDGSAPEDNAPPGGSPAVSTTRGGAKISNPRRTPSRPKVPTNSSPARWGRGSHELIPTAPRAATMPAAPAPPAMAEPPSLRNSIPSLPKTSHPVRASS